MTKLSTSERSKADGTDLFITVGTAPGWGSVVIIVDETADVERNVATRRR